jgi:hypothetical protein
MEHEDAGDDFLLDAESIEGRIHRGQAPDDFIK